MLQHTTPRCNTLQHSATHYNTQQHLPLVARGTPVALQHIATPLRVLPSKKKIDTIKQKNKSTMRGKRSEAATECAKRCVLPAGPFMEWLLCVACLYCHVSFAKGMTVCCNGLQRVATCCSVMRCVAVCCSVLQCVVVCCRVLQCVVVCCSVLQCVAVCCSVMQCVVAYCGALQYVAVCCNAV